MEERKNEKILMLVFSAIIYWGDLYFYVSLQS
jgi:hypothetical protein